ncbi:MAG: GNAT family N-acetyltransferase [Chitinophagaceae bacterium]|nr:GNAT family N-acetyltransferase [Chitinophagaceae bacterium]
MNINNEYEIKELKDGDFYVLIPLMEDCFGRTSNSEYFKWKYVDNPSGYVVGYYAKHRSTGEIAAYYGVIPETYLIKGKETIIYQSCDTMTHSKHRRKGLFKALAFHCYEELRKKNSLFIIGFSGKMSTPGFIKFGWIQVSSLQNYFIPRLFSPFYKSKDLSNIKNISNYEDISHLLNHKYDVPNISVRAPLIYNWRISNPRYNYSTIAYKSNKGYTSYITYNISDRKVNIIDFFYEKKDEFKKLLGYLFSSHAQKDLRGIVALVQQDSIFSNKLKKVGFLSNPFNFGPLSYKTPFIFYSTEDNMKSFNNNSDWALTGFDYDSV